MCLKPLQQAWQELGYRHVLSVLYRTEGWGRYGVGKQAGRGPSSNNWYKCWQVILSQPIQGTSKVAGRTKVKRSKARQGRNHPTRVSRHQGKETNTNGRYGSKYRQQ